MEKFTEKRQLRETLKRRRDALTPEERRRYSRKLCTFLWNQDWYKENEHILVYSAIRSEADVSDFCEKAWQDGKKLYFPKVQGETMEFYLTDSMNELVCGSFSVMEPLENEGRLWSYIGSDRVPILVPGVGFSVKGQRIGYGKGYYDKYLAVHNHLVPIGICFETQLLPELPVDPLDYPMAQIVTEGGCYKVS